MQIIGITGTIGAGKGTIVDYLVSHYHFRHYSVRKYLIKEIERRNLPVNRDSMVSVANELRAVNSPSFIVDQLYRNALRDGDYAIIESVRTPGEIDSLKNTGQFVLLAVDADPLIRYRRIVERNSETDHISYETFLENEQREMNTRDPNKQNLSECIRRADFLFHNNEGFQELYDQVDSAMRKLNIKP